MDAGALATATGTALLLLTSREPASDGGAARVTALAMLPAGETPPRTTFDGCDAEPLGKTERAEVAWAIVFDPSYASKERFRDGRQLALYFVTHLGQGDRMNVIVLGPNEPSASGWLGLDLLTQLRAPLDRTVDPLAPRRGAGDVLARANDEAARAPMTGLVRHVGVAIFPDGDATTVHVAAEGLDVRESIAAGQSQTRGPRLVAEIAAQLARASRASWSLACAKVGPPDPIRAREPDPFARPSRTAWLTAAALAVGAVIALLVWRLRRRG